MNVYLIIYLICGILAAIYTFGTTFAYFQGEFPVLDKKEFDCGFALMFSILIFMLPFGFFVPLFLSGFNKHGWKIK